MLLEVGRIGRPHGVTGEVVVLLISERSERVAPGSVLVTDEGPLVVISSRPHQGRHLVRFEGVVDRTGAEALSGRVLRAEASEEVEGLWVHELVGCEVVEPDGTVRGTVVEVQENPASDLLVLDSGALVPVTFVVEHTPRVQVVIDPPAGLFDL